MIQKGTHSNALGPWLVAWLALALLQGCTLKPNGRVGFANAAPKPGEVIPEGASTTGLVHSGGRLCAYWIDVQSVRYDFDVECGHSTIVYVQTRDPRFETPEGLTIGDSFREAQAASGAILKKVDEHCGVLLASGWVARGGPGLGGQDGCGDLLGGTIGYFDTPVLSATER